MSPKPDAATNPGAYICERLERAKERLEHAQDKQALDAAADHLEATLEELTTLLRGGGRH